MAETPTTEPEEMAEPAVNPTAETVETEAMEETARTRAPAEMAAAPTVETTAAPAVMATDLEATAVTITAAAVITAAIMAVIIPVITVETAMEIRTEPIPESQMARPMPQISPQRMETMRPAETKTTNTTGTTETTTSQTRRMVRM